MAPRANPLLVSLWLLSLCTVTWAALHRLSSFQLISPEAAPGLPKRLSVLRVNDLVLAAYDSDSGRLAPRNGYSPGDQELWSEIRTWYRAWDSWVETEYQELVQEINASAPQAEPYYMQVLQACDMNDASGDVRAITRYALNGEDVLQYETDQKRWLAVHPAARPVEERWNQKGESFDVMNVHTLRQCAAFIGLTTLFTSRQTAQPTVHVTLVPETQDHPSRLICHVKGFYPRHIEVTWKLGGRETLGEQLRSRILPNGDPTFQIQVSIELGQEGPGPAEHECVVRHSSLGATPLTVTWDSQATGLIATMWIVPGGILVALGVGARFWCLRRKPGEIVGGREARPHSRPYMALLRIPSGNDTTEACGFLVAEKFVLTAANLPGEVKKGITVILGAHNREEEVIRQTICVKRRIPHPKFNKDTSNIDIMLLELKKGAELNNWVQPIALPRPGERVKPGTVCSIAGWRRRRNKNESFAKRLREADVKVLEDETCLRNPDYDSSTMLCARPPGTGRDPVLLDYCGGPLVCGGRAHGIVPWVSEDGTQPMVCTKIAAFVPWIQETMRSPEPRQEAEPRMELHGF